MKTVRIGNIVALLACNFGLGVSGVGAATVTNSSGFSVGYGFAEGNWGTQETSAVNRPPGTPLPNGSGVFTNGDSVFTIKVAGGFNSSQDFTVPASYARLVWTPPDFDALGNHCERTFSFPQDRNFLIDGLEIIGSGRLIYDAGQ